MQIIVPVEAWKLYGEISRSDTPDRGHDILAILEEDIPFEGTFQVPLLETTHGSPYYSHQTLQTKTVRKSNVFLLGKKQDQCLAERDAKIRTLEQAIAEWEKKFKALNEHNCQMLGDLEHAKSQLRSCEASWNKALETKAVLQAHCEAAQKHLGEKVWLEAISGVTGEAKS